MDLTGNSHELDVCTDCVQALANGGGDCVEPSWCPVSGDDGHDQISRGLNVRTGGYRHCDGSCEEASDAHSAAMEANWPSEQWYVALGSAECEYCGSASIEHDFKAARLTGAVTCSRCGLLPLDDDDRDTDCPGDANGYREACEPWFAWASCDLCGSALGGSREHAVAQELARSEASS